MGACPRRNSWAVAAGRTSVCRNPRRKLAASTFHAVLDRHGSVKWMTRPCTWDGIPRAEGSELNDPRCSDNKGEFQPGNKRRCLGAGPH